MSFSFLEYNFQKKKTVFKKCINRCLQKTAIRSKLAVKQNYAKKLQISKSILILPLIIIREICLWYHFRKIRSTFSTHNVVYWKSKKITHSSLHSVSKICSNIFEINRIIKS